MAISTIKENGFAAIPSATMQKVCHSVAHFVKNAFELVVDILNICKFSVLTSVL
jgi:hypothetical protein